VDKPFASLFTLARALVYGALFMSLWLYWVPSMISPGRSWSIDWQELSAAQFVGLGLICLGAVISLSCLLAFGAYGRGTPAPFDPPRFLVKNWLYRHVRNPMYIGLGVLLIGEALLFPAQRRGILLMMLVLFLVVHLFVVLYEEPSLRRRFGAAYEEYCLHVPRWLPRLAPYRPKTG
jgi:protein-S-isoprenylcysteine O-methyltransferase Ste14